MCGNLSRQPQNTYTATRPVSYLSNGGLGLNRTSVVSLGVDTGRREANLKQHWGVLSEQTGKGAGGGHYPTGAEVSVATTR